MAIYLDPTRPIYIQIIEEIKKRAVRGVYLSGAKLPSVRAMAREMEVNPNTIVRVYMELEREGFIFTLRGQGSFITKETDRVNEERKKFVHTAVDQFIQEISDLQLDEANKAELFDMLNAKISKQYHDAENE